MALNDPRPRASPTYQTRPALLELADSLVPGMIMARDCMGSWPVRESTTTSSTERRCPSSGRPVRRERRDPGRLSGSRDGRRREAGAGRDAQDGQNAGVGVHQLAGRRVSMVVADDSLIEGDAGLGLPGEAALASPSARCRRAGRQANLTSANASCSCFPRAGGCGHGVHALVRPRGRPVRSQTPEIRPWPRPAASCRAGRSRSPPGRASGPAPSRARR